jgi:hypothetical protein
MKRLPGEPAGYSELCAQLQQEKNPQRFSALVDEINALLTEHAKRTALEPRLDEQPQEAVVRLSTTPQNAPIHHKD